MTDTPTDAQLAAFNRTVGRLAVVLRDLLADHTTFQLDGLRLDGDDVTGGTDPYVASGRTPDVAALLVRDPDGVQYRVVVTREEAGR